MFLLVKTFPNVKKDGREEWSNIQSIIRSTFLQMKDEIVEQKKYSNRLENVIQELREQVDYLRKDMGEVYHALNSSKQEANDQMLLLRCNYSNVIETLQQKVDSTEIYHELKKKADIQWIQSKFHQTLTTPDDSSAAVLDLTQSFNALQAKVMSMDSMAPTIDQERLLKLERQYTDIQRRNADSSSVVDQERLLKLERQFSEIHRKVHDQSNAQLDHERISKLEQQYSEIQSRIQVYSGALDQERISQVERQCEAIQMRVQSIAASNQQLVAKTRVETVSIKSAPDTLSATATVIGNVTSPRRRASILRLEEAKQRHQDRVSKLKERMSVSSTKSGNVNLA